MIAVPRPSVSASEAPLLKVTRSNKVSASRSDRADDSRGAGGEDRKGGGNLLERRRAPYRVDVQREADLVEDILRIYGYNNVEIPAAVHSTLSYAPKPDKPKLINLASDFLSANGFTEIMSNSPDPGEATTRVSPRTRPIAACAS